MMCKIMIYLEKESIEDCLNLIEAANIICNNKNDFKIYGI